MLDFPCLQECAIERVKSGRESNMGTETERGSKTETERESKTETERESKTETEREWKRRKEGMTYRRLVYYSILVSHLQEGEGKGFPSI